MNLKWKPIRIVIIGAIVMNLVLFNVFGWGSSDELTIMTSDEKVAQAIYNMLVNMLTLEFVAEMSMVLFLTLESDRKKAAWSRAILALTSFLTLLLTASLYQQTFVSLFVSTFIFFFLALITGGLVYRAVLTEFNDIKFF